MCVCVCVGAVPAGALEAAKEEVAAAETKKDDKPCQVAYVEPTMVKTLLGQGHPMFSTRQQQDAQEYLQYLLEKLETYVDLPSRLH